MGYRTIAISQNTDSDYTKTRDKWHLTPSNSFPRMHECNRPCYTTVTYVAITDSSRVELI